MTERLNKAFFNQTCDILAKKLLGKILCRKFDNFVLRGRIVETEMYPGATDKASHSFGNKKTKRNGAMFMEPGTSYVYFIYGMYFCFNISSADIGGCVLIRSLEPLDGLEAMKANRLRGKKKCTELKVSELCSGPSKLCQAMDITKANSNELDLSASSEMWLEEGAEVVDFYVSKRVGIDSAGSESVDKLYRFYEKRNIHVSVIDKEDEASPRKRKKTVQPSHV